MRFQSSIPNPKLKSFKKHVAQTVKNLKAKNTIKTNKARRKELSIKVITLKVVDNKLKKRQRESIRMCFLEAKWTENYLVGSGKFNESIPRVIPVVVFNPETGKCDKVENRPLNNLGSQMITAIRDKKKTDLSNLAKKKAKGQTVGALKFVKEVNCIELLQHKITYSVMDKHVFIQRIGKLKVKGLDQFKKYKDYEITQGKLLQRPDGYYVQVTIYVKPEPQELKGTGGIDFGVKTPVTLSVVKEEVRDVSEPEVQVTFPKTIKKLHQTLSRKQEKKEDRPKVRMK